MSASATAKQKVETLHEQLKAYQNKLQRQEQGLRRLQAHISQTRTVVDITMPGEIDKAHREYISTLGRCDKAVELRGSRSDALCGAARAVVAGLCAVVVWARVVVVLVGVFAAGFVSSTPLLWWSGH